MSTATNLPILITSGEPAGIGPELCALLAETSQAERLNRALVILGDANLLETRAINAGIKPKWQRIDTLLDISVTENEKPGYYILDYPLTAPCSTGKPNPSNGSAVFHFVAPLTDMRAPLHAPSDSSAVSHFCRSADWSSRHLRVLAADLRLFSFSQDFDTAFAAAVMAPALIPAMIQTRHDTN